MWLSLIYIYDYPSASNHRVVTVGKGSSDLYQCFSKVSGKAYALYQHFQKRWYRPFKLYSFKTYTNAFESAGIGTAYASTFKSAGIGLEWI